MTFSALCDKLRYMLDVRRMKVLREVALRGSFSAAAESLSFTQSAVSQQVATLEREAGTILVERGARGVRLTDAGRALVGHTDAILARLAEAEAELEDIAGLRSGRVRLASFESAGSTIVPPAVADFRSRHPGVDLSLALLEPEDSVARLKAGELEIGLVFDVTEGRLDQAADGIERIHLIDDPMYVALPTDHPLAAKRTLKLADLAAEAWIGGSPTCDCNLMVYRACHDAGFEPRIAFESDDYLAIQGFVAAGVGVALIPDLGLTTVREDIVIRSLGAHAPVRRIEVAVLAGGFRAPATTVMLEALQRAAGRYAQQRSGLALAS